MEIDRQVIERLAELSAMRIDESDMERLREELKKIIGYVKLLKSVSVEGIDPTALRGSITNIFDDDRVLTGLTQEEVLRGAPARRGPYFHCPPIIDRQQEI